MVKNEPKVQNGISLLKFFVNSVNFSVSEPSNDEAEENLDIKVRYGFSFDEEDKNIYRVDYLLEINSEVSGLHINLDASGIFEALNAVDEDFMSSDFVTLNSPAILFPYIRSYITNLTVSSGISPLILPTFNFT